MDKKPVWGSKPVFYPAQSVRFVGLLRKKWPVDTKRSGVGNLLGKRILRSFAMPDYGCTLFRKQYKNPVDFPRCFRAGDFCNVFQGFAAGLVFKNIQLLSA